MKKVLIIEDDSVILYGLKAKFSSLGVKSLTSNGTEEIKDLKFRINKEHPDYVILDLILPNIEGIEVLKEIKSDISGWKMPVFVFSNLADKDTKERCDNLGADYYFIKTNFSIDEFAEKVIKIINNIDKNKS